MNFGVLPKNVIPHYPVRVFLQLSTLSSESNLPGEIRSTSIQNLVSGRFNLRCQFGDL